MYDSSIVSYTEIMTLPTKQENVLLFIFYKLYLNFITSACLGLINYIDGNQPIRTRR